MNLSLTYGYCGNPQVVPVSRLCVLTGSHLHQRGAALWFLNSGKGNLMLLQALNDGHLPRGFPLLRLIVSAESETREYHIIHRLNLIFVYCRVIPFMQQRHLRSFLMLQLVQVLERKWRPVVHWPCTCLGFWHNSHTAASQHRLQRTAELSYVDDECVSL